jgi:hypothetical protein
MSRTVWDWLLRRSASRSTCLWWMLRRWKIPSYGEFKKSIHQCRDHRRILATNGSTKKDASLFPHVRDNVKRYSRHRGALPWMKTSWSMKKNSMGMPARVIQHEYDHIKGVLFVDHLSELRKRLHQKQAHQYLERWG